MTHQIFSTVIALLFIVVILILAPHTYAIKCYVCGEGSEAPFYDTKSTSINQSFVKERIQTSCDGFDSSLTPQEREKYAIECPAEYKSCSFLVGEHVMRSCFKHMIKDCKNFNSNRYCYCDHDLCNKEDVGAFIEQSGQKNPEDDEGGDDDMETEESGDDEDYEEITSRETHQHESTTINKIISKVNEINQATTMTSTTEAPIPANKAVNFNLAVHFLILVSLINIFVATGYNNYNLS